MWEYHRVFNGQQRAWISDDQFHLPKSRRRATDGFLGSRRQVEMALAQKDCVLGSRLAIWMLKEADLKIYLDATVEERARRIHEREGGALEEKIAETSARDAKDTARYKRLYDIDNNDPAVADIRIDTTRKSAAEVARIIVNEVRSRTKNS
jgi:cytidylate kinase